MAVEDGSGLSSGQERIDRREDLDDDDDGGVESFFAWFFRGTGPPGVLSGAAFQKNRLSSVSSAYATLFEEDHVASLLGAESPGAVLASLARLTGESTKRCEERLRKLAFEFFSERSRRREGYARLHVFEGYQAAGLRTNSGVRRIAGRSRCDCLGRAFSRLSFDRFGGFAAGGVSAVRCGPRSCFHSHRAPVSPLAAKKAVAGRGVRGFPSWHFGAASSVGSC